ncbi:MAG: DUF5668 domain-containing protein [Flammeovirgaceae bacterium]|nr:DUF5668 domain-containing protein [Flammeovirgaceae bacterium]
MEVQENKSNSPERKRSKSLNNAMAGTVLIIIGAILFADRAGVEFPDWLFTWPMILVAVGIFIGAKEGFRDWGWLIPITVGVVFLFSYHVEGYSFQQLWPVIIIVVGVTMLLNSGKKHRRSCR